MAFATQNGTRQATATGADGAKVTPIRERAESSELEERRLVALGMHRATWPARKPVPALMMPWNDIMYPGRRQKRNAAVTLSYTVTAN
jgi:hypothetical protein